MRRGRIHPQYINTGVTPELLRILAADNNNRCLLQYAELKLPHKTRLKFKITEKNGENFLHQTTPFRPDGPAGACTGIPYSSFTFLSSIEWHAILSKRTLTYLKEYINFSCHKT